MGQYYKPVNTETNESLYSHDYGNGLKLMEHSYLGNDFVGAVESLLVRGGSWHKKPIVWAGDYSDNVEGVKREDGEDGNYYDAATENLTIKPKATIVKEQFIVNHTKKEYVNKANCPNPDGWGLHPLPLLTCLGNGRGGGDFRGDNDYIGTWANDVISVEKKSPLGFTEIVPNFQE